jgi:transcriptional regulator with XRE-family HTH domain
MEYYEKLRMKREQKKYSQMHLAEKLNTNQKQISRYETGENTMSVKMLKRYCEILECSADEILGLKKEEKL